MAHEKKQRGAERDWRLSMTLTRIGQDHWVEVGDRIERAREWVGLIQDELADALEELVSHKTYSRTSISNIEKGDRALQVDELRALAYVLDQSEEWLDGEEGATFNASARANLAKGGYLQSFIPAMAS
jgi:transcriptional regulator with XRE-family HTH domain